MLLEIYDVHVYYGCSQVLHGTTLGVDAGEVYGLLGRNGMGKSTSVHTIAGFMRPAATRLPSTGSGSAGRRARPQGRRVFKSLSVGEHPEIPARDGGSEGWSVFDVCDRFRILADRRVQMAGAHSGGSSRCSRWPGR